MNWLNDEDFALRYRKLTTAQKAKITRDVNKMAKDNPNEDKESYRTMLIRVKTRSIDEAIEFLTR